MLIGIIVLVKALENGRGGSKFAFIADLVCEPQMRKSAFARRAVAIHLGTTLRPKFSRIPKPQNYMHVHSAIFGDLNHDG